MNTPWDNPDRFEKLTLREVVERKRTDGLSTSELNLWDGNECFANKTIDPYPDSVRDDRVSCLYSGVAVRGYSLDRTVYLEK